MAPPVAVGPPPTIPKGMEGIAKLPIAEQHLALRQRMCPVSNQLLGSMGMPLKATAKGRSLYVCCRGCLAEFQADPDAFLPGSTKPASIIDR